MFLLFGRSLVRFGEAIYDFYYCMEFTLSQRFRFLRTSIGSGGLLYVFEKHWRGQISTVVQMEGIEIMDNHFQL